MEKSSNTLELLNDFKSYMSFPNFIVNDFSNSPSIWYINSLLYYLNIMPNDYKKMILINFHQVFFKSKRFNN